MEKASHEPGALGFRPHHRARWPPLRLGAPGPPCSDPTSKVLDPLFSCLAGGVGRSVGEGLELRKRTVCDENREHPGGPKTRVEVVSAARPRDRQWLAAPYALMRPPTPSCHWGRNPGTGAPPALRGKKGPSCRRDPWTWGHPPAAGAGSPWGTKGRAFSHASTPSLWLWPGSARAWIPLSSLAQPVPGPPPPLLGPRV